MEPTFKLKTSKVQYIEVQDSNLESFINQVYGNRDYRCASANEWRRDGFYYVNVVKEPLDAWDLKMIEELQAGQEPSFSVKAVLTDLCNRDLIEPGDYLIAT